MKLENKLIPEEERLSSLEAQPGYLAKDMEDDDYNILSGMNNVRMLCIDDFLANELCESESVIDKLQNEIIEAAFARFRDWLTITIREMCISFLDEEAQDDG